MNIKKLISVFLVFAVVVLNFASCSAKTLNNKSPEEITSYLQKELKAEDLTEVSEGLFSGFFGFDAKDIGKASFLISSVGNTSDMIGAFKYKDEEAKNKVLKSLADYLNSSSDNLKAVSDEEYKKVNNRVICECNGTIILVVCENYKKAQNLLKDLGATEVK